MRDTKEFDLMEGLREVLDLSIDASMFMIFAEIWRLQEKAGQPPYYTTTGDMLLKNQSSTFGDSLAGDTPINR